MPSHFFTALHPPPGFPSFGGCGNKDSRVTEINKYFFISVKYFNIAAWR